MECSASMNKLESKIYKGGGQQLQLNCWVYVSGGYNYSMTYYDYIEIREVFSTYNRGVAP